MPAAEPHAGVSDAAPLGWGLFIYISECLHDVYAAGPQIRL